MVRIVSLLLAVTAAALGWAACSEPQRCQADSCPDGYVCGATGCEPQVEARATGDLGQHTALALASDGRRVIATYDATQKNLVLATERADGGLDIRVIDGFTVDQSGITHNDAGLWSSLAVDAAGSVHLSWYDRSRGQLRYTKTTPDSQDIVIESLDGGTSDRGSHSSLALTRTGSPVIAYRDRTALSLRFAFVGDDGQWQHEEVPECSSDCDEAPGGADYGEYAQTFVVGDKPRIVFYDRANGVLKLAERSVDGQWFTSTIDSGPSDVGRFASVAVDSNDRLVAAYYDADRGSLRLYRDSDQGTFPIVVDDGAFEAASGAFRRALVGQHPAVVVDDKDNAVVVYLDATHLRLKLARVAGDSVVEISELELPAGTFLGLKRDPARGALVGAYGAWMLGPELRTRLELFTIVGSAEIP